MRGQKHDYLDYIQTVWIPNRALFGHEISASSVSLLTYSNLPYRFQYISQLLFSVKKIYMKTFLTNGKFLGCVRTFL